MRSEEYLNNINMQETHRNGINMTKMVLKSRPATGIYVTRAISNRDVPL